MPNRADQGTARAVSFLGIAASLLLAAPALAAPDEGSDKGDAGAASATPEAPGDKGADKFDPTEDPSKPYRFLGVRFRDVVVPKFMINIFADGGTNVNVPMGGLEFTTRKDHFEFVFALQYADYGMQPFLFKGHTDGEEAYEIVRSELKQVLFTVDLLYEIPLDKQSRFSFLIGGGVGFGYIFGDLYRSQAYPKAPGANTANPDVPGEWAPCSGASSPAVTTAGGRPYCDSSNQHFTPAGGGKGYSEPSWAGGGSTPLLFPWIAFPQLGFRYKPIKQLQIRLDAGFSTSGFFFGLAPSYGF